MIIDFSAHDAWDFCPAKWFELYINKRRKRWPKAQRTDALALGSLVHEGLRVWQQKKLVEIPQQVIEEVTPSAECLNLAQELVWGYTRAYPSELWPLIMCEEPLQMPLAKHWAEVSHRDDPPTPMATEELILLAKIDSYFYVPELTQIQSGVPGLEFTLNPGWWIHEYKTKSPRTPVAIYMQSWEMGLQASYQTLALQHHIDTNQRFWVDTPEGPMNTQVQGVLVNVLEKPEKYIPQRSCKACGEKSEFYTWLPTGTGLYACPLCGTRREIKPLKEATPVKPPNFFRVLVQRDAEQLAQDTQIILQVGQQMIQMQAGGLHSQPWRKRNCVDIWWKKPCDYFSPHRNGNDTREDEVDYMDQPEYRGLVQIEGGL